MQAPLVLNLVAVIVRMTFSFYEAARILSVRLWSLLSGKEIR